MRRHWPLLVVALLALVIARQSSTLHARYAESGELIARLDSLNTALSETAPQSRQAELSATEPTDLQQRAVRVHQFRGDVTMARQQLEKLKSVVAKLAGKYQTHSNQLAFAEEPDFPRGYRPQHELSNQGRHDPRSHGGDVFLREHYRRLRLGQIIL